MGPAQPLSPLFKPFCGPASLCGRLWATDPTSQMATIDRTCLLALLLPFWAGYDLGWPPGPFEVLTLGHEGLWGAFFWPSRTTLHPQEGAATLFLPSPSFLSLLLSFLSSPTIRKGLGPIIYPYLIYKIVNGKKNSFCSQFLHKATANFQEQIKIRDLFFLKEIMFRHKMFPDLKKCN